jgi:hypothetical protein
MKSLIGYLLRQTCSTCDPSNPMIIKTINGHVILMFFQSNWSYVWCNQGSVLASFWLQIVPFTGSRHTDIDRGLFHLPVVDILILVIDCSITDPDSYFKIQMGAESRCFMSDPFLFLFWKTPLFTTTWKSECKSREIPNFDVGRDRQYSATNFRTKFPCRFFFN